MPELDLLCAWAWPALEEELVGSWRIRFAQGVTKRANSVLPLAPERGGDLDGNELADRIDRVEAAYRARGLPHQFQVTDTCWPAQLPSVLTARGYVEHDPTLILAAPLAEAATEGAWRVELASSPVEAWFDAWSAIDGRGGEDVARVILRRIELPCAFASCLDDDGVAGVGLGVLHGEWLGVYCMGTQPRSRRRGCARAVLAGLARWAFEHGARHAYLLVAEANEPAQRLYRSAGFGTGGRYRYFTLPS
jgi:ribosomal protein S18 acetylase RimI-like enzyme